MPRHLLTPDSPGTSFLDSLLLGNGSLGAALTGASGVVQLDLNVDTLWSGGPLDRPDDVDPAVLSGVRSLVAARDFLAADEAACGLQSSGWSQSYQPLGRLTWTWTAAGDGDELELDLARGVARTRVLRSGSESVLQTLVSAPDEVLVCVVDAGSEDGVADPQLRSPHVTQVEQWESGGARWLAWTGRVPAHVLPPYKPETPDRPAVVYADDEPDADGLVDAGMGWALVVAHRRLEDGRHVLVGAAVSGFRGWDQRPSADVGRLVQRSVDRVSRALRRPADELIERHVTDHGELFDRVDLDLSSSPSGAPGSATDPARAELYFDLGRYLLIASSRPGSQAANLQGIWNIDVRPAWSSNYTTNINVEMNYWLAESTSLPELHQPFFDLTSELARAGREQARTVYGADGAVVHHNTDIWRFTSAVNGNPQWANWPSGLLWMAAHLGDHLDFAWDSDFARDVALPVHEAACAFALDMLVVHEDGLLVVSPSSSPEHRFVHEGGAAAISAGATMDQELVLQAFGRLLDLAERTGTADEELAARVEAALPRVRRPVIGASGALLEWADERKPSEPGHRHVSHLYGVYPGDRVTASRAPDELVAAAAALRHRLAHGGGHTGWSRAWTIALAARIGDAVLAEESICALLREQSSPTLMDLHPMGSSAVFQIDGNFGGAAGIAELLVQSHDDAIALLPALPPAWPNGSLNGMRARGGHRVDVRWRDHALAQAEVTSAGGAVVLDISDENDVLVIAPDGHLTSPVPVAAPAGRRRLRWEGSPGVYRISPSP